VSFLEEFDRGHVRSIPHGARSGLGDGPDDRSGFDEGYRAGWDDALAAAARESGEMSEALRERLLQISHTQDAANRAALTSLEPLLHELFDKVLPRAADRSFISVIMEEAQALLGQSASDPFQIAVCPEDAAAVRLQFRSNGFGAVAVVEDATLSASQATLRCRNEERKVDLQGVLAHFDTAFEEIVTAIQEA
jgi:flagellar assembly protein FliH